MFLQYVSPFTKVILLANEILQNFIFLQYKLISDIAQLRQYLILIWYFPQKQPAFRVNWSYIINARFSPIKTSSGTNCFIFWCICIFTSENLFAQTFNWETICRSSGLNMVSMNRQCFSSLFIKGIENWFQTSSSLAIKIKRKFGWTLHFTRWVPRPKST